MLLVTPTPYPSIPDAKMFELYEAISVFLAHSKYNLCTSCYFNFVLKNHKNTWIGLGKIWTVHYRIIGEVGIMLAPLPPPPPHTHTLKLFGAWREWGVDLLISLVPMLKGMTGEGGVKEWCRDLSISLVSVLGQKTAKHTLSSELRKSKMISFTLCSFKNVTTSTMFY